jgi:putative hemolysin
MGGLAIEIIFLLLLLAANGLFAMAELAVVSSRKSLLRQRANDGDPGAQAALALAESPNRFLSTVQVGITLVGIGAGAFGGATLATKLSLYLADIPILARYADKIAFAIVVVVITYLSLILGELVPKQIALSNPERIASLVARPMRFLARIASPLVTFLTRSTEHLLVLVGFKPVPKTTVSEEEVRGLMQEGLRAGAFNRVESQIVHQALELDHLPVREIMTPRPKMIWLNQTDSHEQIWHKIVISNHSYFPVNDGNRDRPVGIVSVKAIYANLAAGAAVHLRDLMVKPLAVHETQTVLRLVELFKRTGRHVALVVDEFGVTVGIVTLNDIMEAVVGEFPSQGERARASVQAREDGTWIADGLVNLDTVEAALPGVVFTEASRRDFQTLAGWLMSRFGHVPAEGEATEAEGYLFEVLDLDGQRIDKVLVIKRKPAPPAPSEVPSMAPPAE